MSAIFLDTLSKTMSWLARSKNWCRSRTPGGTLRIRFAGATSPLDHRAHRHRYVTGVGDSGSAKTPGSFTFTVRATDAGGCTGTRSYTLVVG